MLNKELKERLINLAQIAKPNEKQLENLLNGWKTYFFLLNILKEKQINEFDGIIRARIFNDSISIVAPDQEK